MTSLVNNISKNKSQHPEKDKNENRVIDRACTLKGKSSNKLSKKNNAITKTKNNYLAAQKYNKNKYENKQVDIENEINIGTDDLSTPGLCSALQLASEIQCASNKYNISQISNVHFTKGLSQEIKQKAVKKTNVPFERQIFEDLVNLQIDDEEIISGIKVQTKSNNFGKNKDIVVDLYDYCKPDFSSETCIGIPLHKDEIEKVQYYNGSEIYNKISSLNMLWN